MQLNEEIATDVVRIRTYSAGKVNIDGQIYTTPIVVTGTHLYPDMLPETVEQLNTQHIEQLCALNPEILLLGTGARQIFPPHELLQIAAAQQLGLEVMDSRAACRAFAVLSGERRTVLLALFV